MRIAVDVRNITSNPTGIGVYVSSLIRELSKIKDLEIHLFGTRDTSFPIGCNSTQHILPRGARFHFSAIRKFYRMNFDLYHSPNSGLVAYFLGKRAVLTIHDLVPVLFPKTASIGSRAAHLFIRLASNRCGAIISVSESTKRDIEKYWNPPTKIHAIWSGSDRAISPITNKKTDFSVPEEFFLSVGTLEPRKNLSTLLRGYFDALDSGVELPPILVVGADGWRGESSKLSSIASKNPGKVKFLGYLDDESLFSLYSSCKALFFPSIYEGAGLPPLEAARLGSAVVCSDIPSLREVFDGAAMFVQPMDYNEWKRALIELNSDPNLVLSLGKSCQKAAKRLSFSLTAEKTVNVYHEVLKNKDH